MRVPGPEPQLFRGDFFLFHWCVGDCQVDWIKHNLKQTGHGRKLRRWKTVN
jgi:hypothetical protein